MKNNYEVEIHILGNCIFDTDTFLKVLDKGIEPKDFYSTNNENLFNALIECDGEKGSRDILIFNQYCDKEILIFKKKKKK